MPNFPVPNLSDLRQDLQDARSLLEQSGSENEQRKYRKAAEIILLKALHREPENAEAKALLQSARAVPVSIGRRTPEQAPNDASFTAAPAPFPSSQKKQKKKSGLKLSLWLIATVLMGGGLLLILYSHPANPAALAAPVMRAEPLHVTPVQPAVIDVASATPPAPDAPPPATVPQPVRASQTPFAIPAAAVTAVALPAATSLPRTANKPPEAMGSLAVSSYTAAEIYQGDRYLGSTPTTLQLPPGRQTLEYRHGELRTVVNHDIKSNQTTPVSITFQTTVQINSKPWAQVFLDGTPRRPLGQTPLSGISVPIGGVLIFENPSFTSKTYRITDKDTAIQVEFP
jgi:hypothetical protein